MLKDFNIPPSFSLVRRGKVYLLLKDEYKDLLLQQGIEDPQTFLQEHRRTSRYLRGRTPHPSIHIKDGPKMVIRQYTHGGLLRVFTGKTYLFGSRSFRELILTEEMIACGIPTIEPIGAIHQTTHPPFYKAYFLSEEIPEAVDLAKYFQEIGRHPTREGLSLKRRTIRLVGLLIRHFHQAGFFHGDLQLKNILASGDHVRLIDFDHSYRKPMLSDRERMNNLLRLNRSVEKWKRLGLPLTWTDRMRFFLAYAGDDPNIRRRMKRAFRCYSLRFFLYRCGWALDRIFFKNIKKLP